MNRAPTLLFVLGSTLGVAACNGNPEAPPTPPPVASAEVTAGATVAPAATAAPAASGTTDVSNLPSWRPSKCAEYSFTPTDCSGSAENPNCTESFELHPDGKVVKVFGDIMTKGSYESSSNTVTVRVPERDFNETLTIEEDGKVLVGSKGERYQRVDCR